MKVTIFRDQLTTAEKAINDWISKEKPNILKITQCTAGNFIITTILYEDSKAPLTYEETKKVLDETNLSNKYDRLNLFFQLTKGGHVNQNIFSLIMEKYFKLKI